MPLNSMKYEELIYDDLGNYKSIWVGYDVT